MRTAVGVFERGELDVDGGTESEKMGFVDCLQRLRMKSCHYEIEAPVTGWKM